MQLDTTGRIIGSFLIVTAYFIVLHVSATVGTQLTYGTFDNIDDAVECGRDVLTDVALSQVA